jgi:hypothetical protein
MKGNLRDSFLRHERVNKTCFVVAGQVGIEHSFTPFEKRFNGISHACPYSVFFSYLSKTEIVVLK